MLNRSIRTILFFTGVLLAVLPLTTADASAGFLIGSARVTTTDPYPFDMTVGDLDGDGIPDGALVSFQEERLLTIHRGIGDGALGEAESLELDSDGWMVLCGDMDNDGDNDLVMFSEGDNEYSDNFITVLLNDGTAHFPSTWRLTLSPKYYEIRNGTLADLNLDGNLDLAVLDRDNNENLIVFFGAGDGTLAENARYTAGDEPRGLAANDLDQDGHIDIVMVCRKFSPPEHGSIQVLYNLSDGTFEPAVEYLLFPEPTGIDCGDLDGDGDIDLAVTGNEEDEAVATLLSRGDRTFMDPVYYDQNLSWANTLTLAERTGDGLPDAVVLNGDGVQLLPGNGDGTFGSAISYLVGPYSTGMILEDMNGDGQGDVVTFCADPYFVSVLLGSGNGGFNGPWMTELDDMYDEGGHSTSGDFNNDGFPDIAACVGRAYIFTLAGNGDGTFQLAGQHYLTANSQEARTADLDQDGNLDLLVACGSGSQGSLCLFPGNGDGTFGDLVSIDLVAGAYGIEVGHLDGDSNIDAVIVTSDGLQVMHGNGNGGFTFGQLPGFTDGWSGVSLGDLDEDGDLDLALHSYDPPQVMVAFNNGSGEFGNQAAYDADHYPNDSTLGDFNGDGHLDLATCNSYNNNGNLFFGDGTGSLAPGPDYTMDVDPWKIEAGDMYGDGFDDLVVGTNPDFHQPNVVLLYRSSSTGFSEPPERYYGGADTFYVDLFDADVDGDLDIATHPIRHRSSIWMLLNSSGGLYLAAGPGKAETNPAEVRTFDPLTSNLRNRWTAYGADRWGVNVALGELTGSGHPEVVTGAGPGAVFGPHVRGFSSSGTPLPGVSWLAYGTNKYGVNVACGDLDSDGFDEIVTGAGPGAVFGPHVRGWNWDGAGAPTPIPGISYFAYGTPKWGVNVSCGDIDGDGYDEIVTGAGPGAVYGPHVRGWNCDGSGATAIPGVSFLAYGTNKYGVNVCCGDIDGDGIDEIVTGAGPGAVFGPHVRGWNWDGTGAAQSIPGVSFFAYSYTQWGANVSCGDLDNDGIDEILTGPGPGQDHMPRVRGWNYDGQVLTAMSGVDFNAYDTTVVTHGVKVAGNRQ